MKKARIQYFSLPDEMRRDDKLKWLASTHLKDIAFDTIHPDKNNQWLEQPEESDWETLLPVATKEAKLGKNTEALFGLYSLGVVTNRDEWVYDKNIEILPKKVSFLIDVYNIEVDKHKGKSQQEIGNLIDYSIKWTRAVKQDLEKGKKYSFDKKNVRQSIYRPFVKKHLYFSKELNEMRFQMPLLFPPDFNNKIIGFSGTSSSKPFHALASDMIMGLDTVEKTQCLPLYRYEKDGTRRDNLTDWGLDKFQSHYSDKKISKEAVFNYVYAVLHCPAYRAQYALNLKIDFPRIPFYKNFWEWEKRGKELMGLHIGYENLDPYPLKRIETEFKGTKEYIPKTKLKADKDAGSIAIDEGTTLAGIPAEAWEYKLGNRSALEWVLDQYKESKPKDPTIAAQFDTYRFADYKEEVIALLGKVCRASLETVLITSGM